MKFEALLDLVGEEPVFESGLLLTGDVNQADVQRQLSRWVASNKLCQLRRGVYMFQSPFRKVRPHPFHIANRLVPGSYVSLHSVLASNGVIPEHVPITTSVTTARPGRWETPVGVFQFHHIQRDLFTGFRRIEVSTGQKAFVATPTKALLDLIHLVPGADSPNYLEGLRLNDIDKLELTNALEQSSIARRPKLRRAIAQLQLMAAA
jgi:hypothetical protein